MSWDRYRADLQAGLEFEDFVVEQLYQRGTILVGFKSKAYNHGENKAGYEIKHDRNFRETGNLFIETAECQIPGQPMKPAGIYARDNSYMYVIGDRELLFEIPHAFLRRAHEAAEGNHFRYRRVAIATAEGFLLPVQRAHLLAARVIEIAKAVEAPAPVPSLGACSNCHESPATIEHETERLCRPCDLAIYPEAAEE